MSSTRRPPAPVAAFVRFVVFGGGTGLASSAALVYLSGTTSVFVANAIVTVLSTLVANELHSRLTFRNGRASLRIHAESSGTAALGYLFTTAAMLVLDAATTQPGTLTEQAVYLTASGLAGIGRFVALRVFVFARPARENDRQPAAGVGARSTYVLGAPA